jgi:hypothetical protein
MKYIPEQSFRQVVGGQGILRVPARSWTPRREVDRRPEVCVCDAWSKTRRAVAQTGAMALVALIGLPERSLFCCMRRSGSKGLNHDRKAMGKR